MDLLASTCVTVRCVDSSMDRRQLAVLGWWILPLKTGRRYFLMNNIIRPVGDSWTFYSPFPPQVTSWLVDVLDQLWKMGIRF